jgi:hypothetical protein
MSTKRKENEDSAMAFKQEPGQSKDDAWLILSLNNSISTNQIGA